METIRFDELELNPKILRGIKDMGFEEATPIQAQGIPAVLSGRDVIGQAQTGTGKTAAFGIPVLESVDASSHKTQVIILSPTRELAIQVADEIRKLAKYMHGVKVLPVYGGQDISRQTKALKGGVQIIIGTPGRLMDHLRRKTIRPGHVKRIVLAEADEMLNMGFVDSINDILDHVPADRKLLLFSATMPSEVARIASQYMKDPKEIVVGTRNEGAANVRHIYYMMPARDKYATLKRVADYNPNIYAIIFCRTRRDTQEIADALIHDGYNADALHGDLSQQQRDLTMRKFRDRVTTLLVATDVAARGLDVDDLTHVINYGLPDDTAVYTHRSGRTGRAGKTGTSVAIIHSREKGRLREIERSIGKKFEHKDVPTPERIIEKQLYSLADRLERVAVNDEEIDAYVNGVEKKLSWLSTRDLLKRVLSLEFNRLLDYYKDAPAIENISDKPERKRDRESKGAEGRTAADKDRRTAERGMARIYVNAGKRDGFYAGNLIDLLNHSVEGQRVDVGRIDLMPGYSLFDVRKADAARVVAALKGADFLGRHLYSEIAEPDKDYAKASERKNNKGRDDGGRPARPRKKYRK